MYLWNFKTQKFYKIIRRLHNNDLLKVYWALRKSRAEFFEHFKILQNLISKKVPITLMLKFVRPNRSCLTCGNFHEFDK